VLTTLFRRKARPGCALAPEETGTDLCHLLEHIALELIAAISATLRCSGVTCGHRSPPHRYDLFLGCEDSRRHARRGLRRARAAFGSDTTDVPVEPVGDSRTVFDCLLLPPIAAGVDSLANSAHRRV
jgi:hypothetical protein